jgi:peptide/nickel transport system substrate-binding protein
VKKTVPLLALALMLGFAACTDDGAEGSGSTSTGGPAALVGDWDINPKAYDELKDGGEFTIMISAKPTTFNVRESSGNKAAWVFGLSPIQEQWLLVDGAGTSTENDAFIASLEDEVVGGNVVVTLKINPDAVWGDGESIDAEDWIATWKALNGENAEFNAASTEGWANLKSVEQGADADEVIFTFDGTYPDWKMVIEDGPLRAESCADPDTFINGWREVNLGYFAGPFIIDNYNADTGDIKMVRNPKWWGLTPKLDTVYIKIVDFDQSAQALANGEVDYYDIQDDVNGYATAVATPGIAIRQANGPEFTQFTFNSKSEIFSGDDGLKLRQAVVMGINRVEIAQSGLSGLPVDPVPLNNNIFVQGQTFEGMEAYEDLGAKTGIDYNPEKAKQVLDDLGWVMNDATGFREKEGKQLDIVYTVLSGWGASERGYTLASAQLKAIGINLVSNPIALQGWFDKALAGDFDIICFGWVGNQYPLGAIGEIYGGDSAGNPGANNVAGLVNPEIEALRVTMNTSMDATERLTAAKKAAELIWTEVHTLPLYQAPQIVAVPDDIANIGANGMAQVPYTWTIIGYVK